MTKRVMKISFSIEENGKETYKKDVENEIHKSFGLRLDFENFLYLFSQVVVDDKPWKRK